MVGSEGDLRSGAPRMLMNIRERFLNHAEQHGFHQRGKAALAVAAEHDPDSAALAEFFHEPLHRGV